MVASRFDPVEFPPMRNRSLVRDGAAAHDDHLRMFRRQSCWPGERVAAGRQAGRHVEARGPATGARSTAARSSSGPTRSATLVVVGENELPLRTRPWRAFDAAVREAVERGTLEIISETQLWQRLGLVDREQHLHRLYTPAMLAGLLGVSVSVIRRWQRRGWIVPVREVRRLAYFDFQEVATARRLTELLAAGMSPAEIEKKLAALARYLPGVKRPLAQLSIIVEGKQLLVRQGDGLVEPGGQLRFDFGAGRRRTTRRHAGVAWPAADILAFADRAAHGLPATPGRDGATGRPVGRRGRPGGGGRNVSRGDGRRRAQRRDLLSAGRAALSAARPDRRARTLLHGHRAGRRLRRGAGQPGLRAGRAGRARAGDRGLRRGAGCITTTIPTCTITWAACWTKWVAADEAESHWRAFLRLAPDSPWADEARERLAR